MYSKHNTGRRFERVFFSSNDRQKQPLRIASALKIQRKTRDWNANNDNESTTKTVHSGRREVELAKGRWQKRPKLRSTSEKVSERNIVTSFSKTIKTKILLYFCPESVAHRSHTTTIATCMPDLNRRLTHFSIFVSSTFPFFVPLTNPLSKQTARQKKANDCDVLDVWASLRRKPPGTMHTQSAIASVVNTPSRWECEFCVSLKFI